MSNKNFDTYLDFGSSQIRAASFNKNDKDLCNLSESFCTSNLDIKKLDLTNVDTAIEKIITDLEKKK